MKSVLDARSTKPVWRGLAVGIVLASVVVAVLVVRATSALGDHSGAGERSASAHLVGLEMVRVQERMLADGVETSLSLRPGAGALLVVPLLGVVVGAGVRRRSRSAG